MLRRYTKLARAIARARGDLMAAAKVSQQQNLTADFADNTDEEERQRANSYPCYPRNPRPTSPSKRFSLAALHLLISEIVGFDASHAGAAIHATQDGGVGARRDGPENRCFLG